MWWYSSTQDKCPIIVEHKPYCRAVEAEVLFSFTVLSEKPVLNPPVTASTREDSPTVINEPLFLIKTCVLGGI